MKTQLKGYAVIDEKGKPMPHSFAIYQKESIEKFLERQAVGTLWKDVFKSGYRCIKATQTIETA